MDLCACEKKADGGIPCNLRFFDSLKVFLTLNKLTEIPKAQKMEMVPKFSYIFCALNYVPFSEAEIHLIVIFTP